MKQTQNTRVLSDEKWGGVLSGERSGSGSYIVGEGGGGGRESTLSPLQSTPDWRGDSVLSGTRGKATAACLAGRENYETVDKR